MNYTFTPQEILAYVYGELDPELAARLESMLPVDEHLLNEINTLRKAKALLDKQPIRYSPAQSSIDKVLEYAVHRSESKFGIGLYQ